MANTIRTQENITAKPFKYPQGKFNDKHCARCKGVFKPSGPSHKYCSDFCFKEAHADKYYLRRYGVGLDWVKTKLEEQGYVCAICGEEGFKMLDTHMTGLNLDHCHKTGLPRGLLCHNCNRGLGLFKDCPDNLINAANYLSKGDLS